MHHNSRVNRNKTISNHINKNKMLKTKISVIRKARLIIPFFAFIVFWRIMDAQDCDGFINPSLDNLIGSCPTEYNAEGEPFPFVGWQQVTRATSDAFCSCALLNSKPEVGGHCSNGMRNFLGGSGYLGPFPPSSEFYPEWIEYVGQCLTTPWRAGETYRVEFDFAQTRGSGRHTINIIGYRGTSCPSVPVNIRSELCRHHGWQVLASIVETSSNGSIVRLSAEFTLSHDISYVAFGECKIGNYQINGDGTHSYFTYDNFCVSSKPVVQCFEASVVLSNLHEDGCPVDVLSELIMYNGEGIIPAGTPLTFYDGDPRVAGAIKLTTYVTTSDIAANATEKLKDVSIGTCIVNSDFLYVVLGDDGSNTIPLDLSNPLANPTYDDCDYTDNISVLKLKKPCAYFESVKKKK